MDKETRVIGIEVETLKEIIHGLVSEELSKMADHIITALRPSKTDLVDGKLYTTNEVAEILGVTRNSIRNYRIEGILPEPSTNLSGRPVWTAEQIAGAGRLKAIKTKFQL